MRALMTKCALAGVGLLLASGCALLPGPRLATPTAIVLPDEYNSPDGLTIGPDGCIYLSMNNAGEEFKFDFPAKVLRITADDKIEEVMTLPPHPETNVASPLGIGFGADGNIYLSDNQAFATKDPGKSRLLRVRMVDGRAVGCAVVATGLTMANGLACNGDSVYVCDTNIDATYPLSSGVYKFPIAELDPAKPIKVTGLDDPRLIVKLKTQNEEHQVGANGLGFDSKGNMYVCNFGDREVWKVTFHADGSVASKALLVRGGGMESTDGLQVDEDDNLWVADFLGNAIAKICSRSGRVKIIAKNAPSDGAGGLLDAPSECIRRGNRVYVSNIDITYGPNTADGIHTMSVIELDR